jgi:uncharacterized protein with von Willebrand factor type A (vWA) domain
MSSYSGEEFDRALVGFAHTLRTAGVNINQHRIQTGYRCVSALAGLAKRENLYWAGRLAFCSRKEDLAIYDRTFDMWFSGMVGQHQLAHTPQPERLIAVPDERQVRNEIEVDDLEVKKVATASELETLRNADLALLSLEARAQVEEWISRLRPMGHVRRTRRFDAGHGSLIDRRKTVRAALRAGGEFAELIFRTRREVPRRVLFLIDISGSMKAYSSAYLRFAYATKQVRNSTEVFTIGTRLTRITRSLTQVSAERAINQALREIPDWSGGTRLGTQLREFIRDHGARGSARGAIVIIASDGWERGDVQILGDGVAHLSRLAKKVIWVNPHLHRPGFAPLTAGMEVALPYVGRLVTGHSYRSFEELCNEIAQIQ